jgi:L-histidine N-alpha-methyltransferase
VARLLDDDAHLLIGLDLVKDPAVIERAYNDAAGVTSAFNRNVLTVINRELGADFAVEAYEHASRSSIASRTGSTSGCARRASTS